MHEGMNDSLPIQSHKEKKKCKKDGKKGGKNKK